jgi:hypothetical protein
MWRKVDLQAIAQDQPVHNRLHRLWMGENSTVPCCLFAAAIIGLGYGEFLALICMPLALVFMFYTRAKLTRPRGTVPTTAPGLAGVVLAVVAVQLLLVISLALFGRPPVASHLPFLATVFWVNVLIAAVIRMATNRLRLRLLYDPAAQRIIGENARQMHSIAYEAGRAATVSAWTEAQRASQHQDIAAALRARRTMWLWWIPAVLAILWAGLAVIAFQAFYLPIPTSLRVGIFVVLAAIGLVVYWLKERADERRAALAQEIKVQTAPSAHYALQRDHRPSILLLRSFVDDATRNGSERFEETIAPWLARYGPLVAIGDPRDTLPSLGAYRDYVAEENWQERVRTYINAAVIIVMIPGKSHWVQWELSQILDGHFLHKTAFVFPPGLPVAEKADRVATTWQAFNQHAELQPFETVDLAQTVVLHFFDRDSITRVTDDAFVGASEYSYEKALFAAFADR